mgnify:CR=1 FL=1|tara:strand:- start:76 stop:1407 length:1332 start_codon:yes stop_codon:yes gene_type:complete
MGTNLTRTPASAVAAERRKFTYSCWIKKCENGKTYFLLSGNRTGSSYTYLIFQTDDSIRFRLYDGGNRADIQASDLFKDPAAWYHVVLQFDSTQGTASDRVKIYINNRQLTDLQSSTYPSQDYSSWINHNSEQGIMEGGDGTCYIAEIHQTGGQIYAPSTFGQTDSTTGEWKPKSVSGVSYGTNGFYLKFANAGAMGTDSSGNSNNFTVNSAGTNPQTIDTPSNNFVTMNRLANYYPNSTFTKGNLSVAMGSSQATFNAGTFGVTKGKWYFEVKPTALGSGTDNCLIGAVSRPDSAGTSDHLGEPTSVVYRNNGTVKYGSTNYASQGPSFTTSDIIGVALDMDNNRITFSKNGQWIDGSGNADEANPTSFYTFPTTMQNDEIAFPAMGDLSTNNPSVTQELNFGNPIYTISSGNADAAGYGNFEYAVPSGYYAICTRNLNTYG